MQNIAEWVAVNLDPLDQELIAKDGPDVSSLIWDLTNEQEDAAREAFHRYCQDIWRRLYGVAEAQGVTPLSLIDNYARRSGETICSPESFEMSMLVWAIEKVCWHNTFTRTGEE